ncbi:hypothetical protein A2U01_0093501, partial [Trifolium medium]|nr:hypothetical protein [Trifolium medium]
DWIFENISGAHNKDWQTVFMVGWYFVDVEKQEYL